MLLLATNTTIPMKQKTDVQQGTLSLMVLKTLEVLGPLHGYGIARRIEQISGDLLSVNQGTLYPVLLRLEQEGTIVAARGPSLNIRSERPFTMAVGGGVDISVSNRVSIRPVEADYVLTLFNNPLTNATKQHNFRYCGGIVLKF
jgi:hypothetical protein